MSENTKPSATDYEVRLVERRDVREFIEEHHYSRNINGLKSSYCFGLFEKFPNDAETDAEENDEVPDGGGERMIGAMIYGTLGMANAWRKYGEREEDVLELRRLVLVDDTLRNAESFFIGRTLKWLKKNTEVQSVVSYADPNYGHSGVIYRATNFEHIGMTSPGRVIMWDGKKYHDKAIRTKYNGELKPFAVRLKNALDSGEARYEKQLSKHIYLMGLRKRKRR